jgi:hypothetical protein
MTATLGIESLNDESYLPQLRGLDFRPVFIIGPHRSGTTLLYRVLTESGSFNTTTAYHIVNRNRLLALRATGQEQAARDRLDQWFAENGLRGKEHNSAPITPDLPEEYCFALEHQGKRIIVDQANLPSFNQFCRKLQTIQDPTRPLLLKNPYDTLNFLYLHDHVPNARFIFIFRHPVDVVNSQIRLLRQMIHQKSEYHALMFHRLRELYDNPVKLALARLVYSEHLPLMILQTSRYVSRNCDYILNNVEKLGNSAMGLTYPQLCGDTNNQIRRILNFLELEEKTPCDYSKLIRGREPAVLPEVESRREWINKRNEAYCRRFGLAGGSD